MNMVISILGPTAIGKTKIAIEVALRISAEIVSIDSRQIYRQMEIGTARPSVAEQKLVPHHLIDCVMPDQHFSVAQFQRKADLAIEELRERKKNVLMVGGSGLYFRAVIDGLFDAPKSSPEIRSRLETEALAKGKIHLHERLRKIDPVTAEQVHQNDLLRIIRSLEVYELTGKPISELKSQWKQNKPRYPFKAFGLKMAREKLYNRINERVDRMISEGLIEEVQSLRAENSAITKVAMQSYGYSEIVDYLDGKCQLAEAIEIIKQKSRRYAKRQMTWFRRDKRIKWIDVTDSNFADVVEQVVIESR